MNGGRFCVLGTYANEQVGPGRKLAHTQAGRRVREPEHGARRELRAVVAGAVAGAGICGGEQAAPEAGTE